MHIEQGPLLEAEREPEVGSEAEPEVEHQPDFEPAYRVEAATGPVLSARTASGFRGRWQEIQASFVDEPRTSVEQADALVADLMQRLAAGFSDERQRLEGQWDRGDDVSTEDLRVALTRYRSFFDRLLAA